MSTMLPSKTAVRRPDDSDAGLIRLPLLIPYRLWAKVLALAKKRQKNANRLTVELLGEAVAAARLGYRAKLQVNGRTVMVQLDDGSLRMCESLAEAERLMDDDEQARQVRR